MKIQTENLEKLFSDGLKLIDYKFHKEVSRKEFEKGFGYFVVSKDVYKELYETIKFFIKDEENDLLMCFIVNPKGSIGEHLLRRKSQLYVLWEALARVDSQNRFWGSLSIKNTVEKKPEYMTKNNIKEIRLGVIE